VTANSERFPHAVAPGASYGPPSPNSWLRSHFFAGQKARLLHPSGELSFVELVVLMDVEVANVHLLGLAGRDTTQRRAAEESHLDVASVPRMERGAIRVSSAEQSSPGFRFAPSGLLAEVSARARAIAINVLPHRAKRPRFGPVPGAPQGNIGIRVSCAFFFCRPARTKVGLKQLVAYRTNAGCRANP
jgi:hypothetical protein